MTEHLTKEALEAGLTHIVASPKNNGLLKMIVARPRENERTILGTGELSLADGLVGDNWKTRGSSKTADKTAHPEMQLNIMNARCIDLITNSDQSRWPLAGDQLYVDLDLSEENLPPGTQLKIGEAVVEVTNIPHLGCAKFVQRFGKPAMLFVNSVEGKILHLRGINAKVIAPGRIQQGDHVEIIER